MYRIGMVAEANPNLHEVARSCLLSGLVAAQRYKNSDSLVT